MQPKKHKTSCTCITLTHQHTSTHKHQGQAPQNIPASAAAPALRVLNADLICYSPWEKDRQKVAASRSTSSYMPGHHLHPLDLVLHLRNLYSKGITRIRLPPVPKQKPPFFAFPPYCAGTLSTQEAPLSWVPTALLECHHPTSRQCGTYYYGELFKKNLG